MNLIWKLLRQNISKVQLAGFAIANLIGLTIVLLGLQFYFDINAIMSDNDTIMKRDFFILTKKVVLMSSVDSRMTSFSKDEIINLKKQKFVKTVGTFTASRYKVKGGIKNANGGEITTDMFFESVPDYFLDVKSSNWRFSPTDEVIPIIMPKNYLDLYNFGFAESQSMPKISQGVVELVNFKITISGQGQSRDFRGRIVGFSSRINTILVPETFMEWANRTYGNNEDKDPNRVIIEVNNPADPNIPVFLKNHGYEVEGENSAVSKMSFFLKVLVGIVVTIGLIICVLSFFILSLSIYLLLEKNMTKLKNLRLIGYGKSAVIKPYEVMTVGMNFGIMILSEIIVFIIRGKYIEMIRTVWTDFKGKNVIYTLFCGLLIFLLLSILNIILIRKKVK